jgi:hypothetical protein
MKRAPMGPMSDTTSRVATTRFHLDFGFIRASSHDYGVTEGHRIDTSYDDNTTYLLITDTQVIYTWVFYQPSKPPPVLILECFLALHGLEESLRYLHIDQGGELLGSTKL